MTTAAKTAARQHQQQNTELIYNSKKISALLKRLMQNAKSRLDICLDSSEPSLTIGLEELHQEIVAAKRRGVTVRFIADITRENMSAYKLFAEFVEIRHLSNVRGDYVIFDGLEYLSTATLHTDKPVMQAIYSNVKEVVEQQQYSFDTIWSKTEPVEKKISIMEKEEDARIEVIKDTNYSKNLYIKLIEGSAEEIMLTVPTFEAYKRQKDLGLVQLFSNAAKRGVKLRLLTPLQKSIEEDLKELVENNSLAVKSIEVSSGPKMTFIIVDHQHCLAIELKDNSKTTFLEAAGQALYLTSKPTVYSYVTMFENFWKSAEINERFKAADKLKDEFINVAAHELRTPLMPILGAMEMLTDRLSNTQDEEIKENTSIIVRNVNRLQKLAEEILQVSRIETGNFTLFIDEDDLNSIISRIIDDIEKKYDNEYSSANNNSNREPSSETNLYSLIVNVIGDVESKEARRSQIVFDPQNTGTDKKNSGLIIRCDKTKISQVIFNILDNAMKFSGSKGKVVVRTRIFDANIIVSIRDNGKGIDPLIQDRLFEKFVSKSENGTGLGLYVSRKIVELHGGKIWAHNNTGDKGATFMFSLPLSPFSLVRYGNEPRWTSSLMRMDGSFSNFDIMRKEALLRIETIKERLVAAREDAMKQRNVKIEEFHNKVEQSRKLLNARQEILNQQINYNKTRQKVDRRIEQGLEGLQRLIEGLKENILGEDTLEKLTIHPILSNAIKLEAQKVQETEFFKSLKEQIEEDDSQ